LRAEGYIVDTISVASDSTLRAAIALFQHRHGLNEDGVAGPATRRAMNVPVERRIQQVRLNLERARWNSASVPASVVVVNVAGAKLYYVRDGVVLTEMRAIVGKAYTRTPLFEGRMTTIQLNPSWIVPPGITHEIVRAAERDPQYLSHNNIKYIDGRYVQAPGPLNPLGRIKFIFPNRFNVYLHDTPAREKFNDEVRLFSHGCIRIQDPLHLAELLLADRGDWPSERLRAAIASGATTRIQLAMPVTVAVMYWTASTDLHGELHYYSDVYGRDGPLLRALDANSTGT
jgi:murein L,D-transpeptidase YcbB/YkuD